MYRTATQLKAITSLNLSAYSDALVEEFSEKATQFIDGYLGQTISLYHTISVGATGEDFELTTETDKVLAIPQSDGAFMIRPRRRFIDIVSNLVIHRDNGLDDILPDLTLCFIADEEGYIMTEPHVCPDMIFSEYNPNHRKYQAEVDYTAGFDFTVDYEDLEPRLKRFIQIFYEVVRKVADDYDVVSGDTDVVPASKKVKKYQTLNETVEFVVSKGVADLEFLSDSSRKILDEFRIGDTGIGIFM